MRYGDLTIGSIDQKFIDNISDKYDVDYYDCELYDIENIDNAGITNALIYYIFETAINELDISDKSKEYLIESIHTNCFCSTIDVDEELVDTNIRKKDRKIVKEFLDL